LFIVQHSGAALFWEHGVLEDISYKLAWFVPFPAQGDSEVHEELVLSR
jgi:hypothetical protein